MRMMAVRNGDRYMLNGAKIWIICAQVVVRGILYAYTKPRCSIQRALVIFMGDIPEISTVPKADTLGWQAWPTGEIVL